MRVNGALIAPQQEAHIWVKHRVTPWEVEEVCSSRSLVLRGRDSSVVVYGQSDAGRYLAVFLYPQGKGIYRLATARGMTDAERLRYKGTRKE